MARPRKNTKILVSDKTYAELARERMYASQKYRDFADKQADPKQKRKLLELARKEDRRALVYMEAHKELIANNPA